MNVTLDLNVTQQQIDTVIEKFIDAFHEEYPDYPLTPQNVKENSKLFTFIMESWILSYYGELDYVDVFWKSGGINYVMENILK